MDFEIQEQAHSYEYRLMIVSNRANDEQQMVSRISPAIDQINSCIENESVYRSVLTQPPIRWVLGPPDSENVRHRVGLVVSSHYLDALLTELLKLGCRVFSKVSSEVSQLIYISTATRRIDIDEIRSIERTAKNNNKSAAVTGILLYNNGMFMQFLEGAEADIKQVFSAIKRDPRHTNIHVLKQDTIPKRQFTDWNMMYTEVNDIHPKLGFIHDKLFGVSTWSKVILANAQETIELLLSFKANTFSCSNYF